MDRRRLHLIAPAGVLWPFLQHLRFDEPNELTRLVRDAIDAAYEVTADETLLAAREDEYRGGRTDDAARARDIQDALADERTAAVIAIRGGAWLTRILPRIDFGVLDRRTRPVAMIGFSELTTLVNIVGAHPHGLGVYDLSPAFLAYGLRRQTPPDAPEESTTPETHRERASFADRIRTETAACFQCFIEMIEGRRRGEPIPCTLVRGAPPCERDATFVGGNLTVLSTLVGTPFERCIDPSERWMMIEDFNDKPERFDRFLAHLTLAGYWERCHGVLLGNFHRREHDLHEAMIAILEHHLPEKRSIPILHTDRIGHVWPMSPLPLHCPLRLERYNETQYTITWPPERTRVV